MFKWYWIGCSSCCYLLPVRNACCVLDSLVEFASSGRHIKCIT